MHTRASYFPEVASVVDVILGHKVGMVFNATRKGHWVWCSEACAKDSTHRVVLKAGGRLAGSGPWW